MSTSIVSIRHACVCLVWDCMVWILFRTSQLLSFLSAKIMKNTFFIFCRVDDFCGRKYLVSYRYLGRLHLSWCPWCWRWGDVLFLSSLLHVFSLISFFLFNFNKTKFKTIILKHFNRSLRLWESVKTFMNMFFKIFF